VATTIAINANQIGIAMSYLTGAYLVHDTGDIHFYFLLMTLVSLILMLSTIASFQSAPPTPPSYSSEDKLSHVAPTRSSDVLAQMQRLLVAPGFDQALFGFVVSIGITNVISTFLEHMLEHLGFHQHVIGLIGAGFQVMIMIGSLILGSYVDMSKRYYTVTMFCFALSFVGLVYTSDHSTNPPLLVGCVLTVGMFIGPVQPITAELAVEVTYPSDENAIVAVQQVFGNLFSALLVPVCNTLRHVYISELKTGADHILILAICSAGGAYFSTFAAPLKRMMTETASAHSDKALAAI